MRLIFDDPLRPRDRFVIADRTDSKDPLVLNGETFKVPDAAGRNLLSHYYPRIKEAPPEPTRPGSPANPIVTKLERAQPEKKSERAAK